MKIGMDGYPVPAEFPKAQQQVHWLIDRSVDLGLDVFHGALGTPRT